MALFCFHREKTNKAKWRDTNLACEPRALILPSAPIVPYHSESRGVSDLTRSRQKPHRQPLASFSIHVFAQNSCQQRQKAASAAKWGSSGNGSHPISSFINQSTLQALERVQCSPGMGRHPSRRRGRVCSGPLNVRVERARACSRGGGKTRLLLITTEDGDGG